jgi:hypothetical protein
MAKGGLLNIQKQKRSLTGFILIWRSAEALAGYHCFTQVNRPGHPRDSDDFVCILFSIFPYLSDSFLIITKVFKSIVLKAII